MSTIRKSLCSVAYQRGKREKTSIPEHSCFPSIRNEKREKGTGKIRKLFSNLMIINCLFKKTWKFPILSNVSADKLSLVIKIYREGKKVGFGCMRIYDIDRYAHISHVCMYRCYLQSDAGICMSCRS